LRVLVTRPREQARPLVDALVERGFDVLVRPLIRVEPLSDDPIDTNPYDWVIVTSPNGAREFARRRVGVLSQVAAIGPGTAAALEEAGIDTNLEPAVHTQEGLVAAFRTLGTPPVRPLFVGAEGSRSVLMDELGAEFLPLYRTLEVTPGDLPEVDLVLLLSPSAARAYARAGGRAPVISIGPQTSAAAEEAGLDLAAEAPSSDLGGLVDSAAAWRASLRS
jgi:uroporphyrinogen-III synthase